MEKTQGLILEDTEDLDPVKRLSQQTERKILLLLAVRQSRETGIGHKRRFLPQCQGHQDDLQGCDHGPNKEDLGVGAKWRL